MSDLLTIGEIARRSGVASSALRFYEQRGLITSDRAGSGHRRYPRASPPPYRLHRLRPAHRVDARGDRRRACEASSSPCPHPPRLVTALGHLDLERSTSASPSSSASSSGSPSASAAAASRSTAVNSPTPATAPPASALARATGSATGRWVNADARRRRASRPPGQTTMKALTTTGSVSPGGRVPRSAGTRRLTAGAWSALLPANARKIQDRQHLARQACQIRVGSG